MSYYLLIHFTDVRGSLISEYPVILLNINVGIILKATFYAPMRCARLKPNSGVHSELLQIASCVQLPGSYGLVEQPAASIRVHDHYC